MADRVTLNVSISRRAYIQLSAHTAANRGGPDGSAGSVIDRLILESLREWRVSRHLADEAEGPAGSGESPG